MAGVVMTDLFDCFWLPFPEIPEWPVTIPQKENTICVFIAKSSQNFSLWPSRT